MKLSLVTLHTAATVVGMLAATACAGHPTPAQELQVGAYGAELLQCVKAAPTRYDADQCRAAVEARYADGGTEGGAR